MSIHAGIGGSISGACRRSDFLCRSVGSELLALLAKGLGNCACQALGMSSFGTNTGFGLQMLGGLE